MIKKHVSRVYQNKHFREMCVYGFVGIMALTVQDLIYLLAPKFGIFPTVAMIIGNFAGMFIAYFGHTKLTFKKTHHFSKREFTKFLVTSCVGLLINVGGVRIITKVLMMDHLWGLLPTFISPIVTFLISKFWAFR